MTPAATARYQKLSKFLSLVLRHQPERIGLALDAQGWADIDRLIDRACAHGMALTRNDILHVVVTSDKQRFQLDDSRLHIRANQGHSIDIDLGLDRREPPPVLFHGTVDTSLAAIRAEGLKPGRRQYVHLSRDAATASAVGQRHGRSVVLSIAADRMWTAGHAFYLSANGVWLTHAVPAEFIAFPEP